MSRRPVTVWWGIPCKSMIPVFEALHEHHCRDVFFVSLHDLPEHRRKLGWTVPPHGSMPLEILGADGWKEAFARRLASRPGLHVLNGIYHSERMRHVARVVAVGIDPFGVIMEAPSNLASGSKWVAKAALAPIITPLRTWPIARKAEFVLSASGNKPQAFRALGFPTERIHPFGYFPDYPLLDRSTLKVEQLKLLCIGYLEPFKGQDVLLRALAMLQRQGVPFVCTITGYGSALDDLVSLSERLGLGECVKFVGVVSNEHLTELFRESSVLVAPGHEEPWGIRINEALLSGLPVVVSDGVGAKELVASSGAGEVFRSGCYRSLATAIERAFARLRGDSELSETVHRFREMITPRAAAGYLENVISMAEDRDVRERPSPNARQLVPPWLDRSWRTRSMTV